MSRIKSIDRHDIRPAFSIKSFPESIRRFSAIICVILILYLFALPLEAGTAGGQVQILKKATSFGQKKRC